MIRHQNFLFGFVSGKIVLIRLDPDSQPLFSKRSSSIIILKSILINATIPP